VNKRYTNHLLLLAAGLVLAACSVSRLAYMNAPPLALWYVGGYVDMTDGQKNALRDKLTQAIAWHRRNELPEYRHAIEALIAKSGTRMPVEEVRSTYALARNYYHRSLDHLLPGFADVILTLDEKQLAQVERKFAEDNKKLVKESVKGPADERRAKLAKKYIEQFEDWTGKLSPAQRDIVVSGVVPMPDLTDERLGDRRYRQLEALNLVRSKPTREKLVTELRRLLINTESWRRPEYARKLRERDEHMFEIVSELTATLTPDQREHLQGKMRGYVKDISSIIASR